MNKIVLLKKLNPYLSLLSFCFSMKHFLGQISHSTKISIRTLTSIMIKDNYPGLVFWPISGPKKTGIHTNQSLLTLVPFW